MNSNVKMSSVIELWIFSRLFYLEGPMSLLFEESHNKLPCPQFLRPGILENSSTQAEGPKVLFLGESHYGQQRYDVLTVWVYLDLGSLEF